MSDAVGEVRGDMGKDIQAYDPRIFVALGMCEDRLVVITTWRGEK